VKAATISLLASLVISAVAVAGPNASDPAKLSSIELHGAESVRQLSGRDARLQLLVTGKGSGAQLHDLTRQVQWSSEPSGIVEVGNDGLVKPLADGEATITAVLDGGIKASTTVSVTDMGHEAPVSFAGKIIPIFTKLGCNGGGCHGKAAGQNGFKLSLLGFEPSEDYERLVRESRGRRLSPASPDRSLLLTKAINEAPHGGGQRTTRDSHEYRMLSRWIAQGMPLGDPNEPTVVSIEVTPQHRRLEASASQQLSVVAHYSNGTSEDVTRGAVFESNDTEMADVSETGLVQLNELAGDVAVMARFQGHVTVFRADIPMTDSPMPQDLFSEPRTVVDKYVFQKLRSLGIPPSPVCDDATFLRRVTLDIAGRLPTLAEVEAFESDASVDKRSRLVDELLSSGDYAEYFANKWNAILRNRRTSGELRFANMAFHQWIRESLAENKPYDQFVREIVTASGSVASHPPVVWFQQVPDINQRIEDAAQLFLGQRIQCARCHHHPYEKWSRADYAQMAAFFSTVSTKKSDDPAEPTFFTRFGGASATHPKTGQSLAPAGLDSGEMSIPAEDDPRVHFADWMTDPENPFFPRSLVNRYWKHFMGRGLVEPEDDLRVTNPPSNPELMDGLAEHLIASGYDTKELIRTIVNSWSYQFDSEAVDENLADRRSYSRFYPKRLQAEVLLDAIDHVTQSKTRFAGMPPGTRAVELPDSGFGSYFLSVFGRPSATTACECERSQEPSLAQNLHLLNSEEIQGKLSADTGRAAVLAADKDRSDEQKITELYRTALGRHPKDGELKATLAYIAGKDNLREAYEDVVWSLINSKEFLFNH
jgi:hypothetical protein